MPLPLVLLDNTVLTNFSLVHRPDLVLDLWGQAGATTHDVLAEYQAGVAARDLNANAWDDLLLLKLSPAEKLFAGTLSAALGAGERSCLAVAVHRQAILATDDGDARRMASNLGLSLTGSLGILALNTRRGTITLTEGNSLLLRLIDLGFRSPVTTLDDLIAS